MFDDLIEFYKELLNEMTGLYAATLEYRAEAVGSADVDAFLVRAGELQKDFESSTQGE